MSLENEKNIKSDITLCILARNEVDNLKNCFSNIATVVDEILLLDTGSTDGTAAVAEALGAKVFQYTWDENFSRARNLLLEKVETEWVLWIDCDEVYPQELVDEILMVVRSDLEYAGYYFPRKNHYLGRWLRHGKNYPDYQLKLFMKPAVSQYKNMIHEKVDLKGKTGRLVNAIEHHPYPTVGSYIQKFNEYTTLEAKRLYDRGERITVANTTKWLLFKPAWRFFRRYVIYGGFRDGFPGFFAAFFDVAGYVVRYMKLWELQADRKTVESESGK